MLNTCSHSPEKADTVAITPLATTSKMLARDPLVNAAAFGIEVGYANLAGLAQKFPKIQGALSKATQDGEYSVFVADGSLFDLEKLKRVKFTIRTDNQIIVSINLVMEEHSSEMVETLTAKYPLIANIKGYSPDRHLLLGKGDSRVEILGNYVPSSLEVRYQTTAFYEALQQQKIDAKIEREAKRDRQL